MAGIGFELRRMLRKDTLLGLVQAYAYASVIGSGPWVLSIVGILLIGIFSASVVIPGSLVTQFQTSVILPSTTRNTSMLAMVVSVPSLVVMAVSYRIATCRPSSTTRFRSKRNESNNARDSILRCSSNWAFAKGLKTTRVFCQGANPVSRHRR